MSRTAVKAPGFNGANVVVMVQEAPLATLVPQVFVWEKTLGFVPLMDMPLILRAVAPVLVSVMSRALESFTLTSPKSRLAGTSFTFPTGIVMVAAADLVVSFADVAVSVTCGLGGIEAGAV